MNDKNYPTTKSGTCEPGAWRVEVSNAENRKSADFLHVLLVYPGDPGSLLGVAPVDGDGLVGVDLLTRFSGRSGRDD